MCLIDLNVWPYCRPSKCYWRKINVGIKLYSYFDTQKKIPNLQAINMLSATSVHLARQMWSI